MNLAPCATTLPERFACLLESYGDEEFLFGVTFKDGKPGAHGRTYGQVRDTVLSAAWALVENGVCAGARVILSVADVHDFLAWLIACQCLGAAPVPLPSSRDLLSTAYSDRLLSVVSDAAPVAIVVDQHAGLHDEVRQSACILDSALLRTKATQQTPKIFDFRRRSSEVAFIQYTSGSTRKPKGVVVLHENLAANIRAIVDGAGLGNGDVVFSWLPLFHDMGLVAGLLLGLWERFPTYIARPLSFLANPSTWLHAISAFRATFSPGPNFAYNILSTRVPDRALSDIDLGSWRLAFNGAEVVDRETIASFNQRFGRYGLSQTALRPAYGLAEATLAVAFTPVGNEVTIDTIDRLAARERALAIASTAPDAITVVGVGRSVPGHAIRIVCPETARNLADREIGEVVVTGPSVSPGYLEDYLRGAHAVQTLRTGDLGYLAAGELFILGRLKDIVVVAGRKYCPTDLERIAETVPGIRAGSVVAFGVRGSSGTEHLYIAAGAEPKQTPTQCLQVADRVHGALLETCGVAPTHVFLVRPGVIPRTSSGKLKRSECAQMLLDGRLAVEESKLTAAQPRADNQSA